MELFLTILNEVTLPIVAVAALGYVTQHWLQFDVVSFNRLQVYVILPCFLLHHLSSTRIPIAQVETTAWFTVVQFLALIAIGWATGALFDVPRSARPVLALSAAFANSGNFGIPVAELAFGKDYILHQAVIVSVHSILITSLGVVLVSPERAGCISSLKTAFRTPMIPAVVCGILLNVFEIPLPKAVATSINVMGSAYTPLALFALGAQLAIGRKRSIMPKTLTLALALRFMIAPAGTWIVVALLEVPPGLAGMLVVGASAPVGVLLAIICAEYESEAGFASNVVFVSTVLSPIFVTSVIFAVRIWPP